jgi:hypothetical protein
MSLPIGPIRRSRFGRRSGAQCRRRAWCSAGPWVGAHDERLTRRSIARTGTTLACCLSPRRWSETGLPALVHTNVRARQWHVRLVLSAPPVASGRKSGMDSHPPPTELGFASTGMITQPLCRVGGSPPIPLPADFTGTATRPRQSTATIPHQQASMSHLALPARV